MIQSRSYAQTPLSRPLAQDITTLSSAYNFSFNIAATTQIFVFSILGAIATFPTLFPPLLAETLTPTKVFKPGPFFSFKPLSSIATGMHTWLLYDQYVGSTAGIIWAMILYNMSRSSPLGWRGSLSLWLEVFGWFIIGGPAGAIDRLLQKRDLEALLRANSSRRKVN
ncbi:hypothetical protein GQ53DRAFT_636497 [Thozetella sp. PMI_491]|nr:hypothetical protein GQ53DRAFT_636497 [Thozetella sp. PMI_491]